MVRLAETEIPIRRALCARLLSESARVRDDAAWLRRSSCALCVMVDHSRDMGDPYDTGFDVWINAADA